MPMAALLYPEWVAASGLDSHRAFTVSYAQGGDVDLAYHYDNAEVTLNVCLGKRFTGGELSFGPMKGVRLAFSFFIPQISDIVCICSVFD